MPAGRPNVVFAFSDQQRWDTCGCYGQELDVTPNLDAMAAEGVRFEKAFTCQPVCGPARASLQTGKYATEVACHTNHRLLPLDATTIAKLLSSAGYATGYVGKWHLASRGPRGGADDFRTRPVPPERRGGYKDYWVASDTLEFTSHAYDGHMFDGDMNRVDFPPGRFRADCVGDFAVDFIRRRGQLPSDDDDARPFFLFASWIEPHHQNDHNCYEGPTGSKERFAGYRVPGDLEGTAGDWRENYPDYLGCCNAVDANLGRIRRELAVRHLAEDTLVIYTSDHGSHFRTRNAEYKRSCHESCIRVPMVLCGPGFAGGKVADNLVSLIDLPRTILSACGVDVPDDFRGRDLAPLARGDTDGWLDEVFLQISESQVGRAIRTPRWKYSAVAPDADGDEDPFADAYVDECLYDLDADPHERRNLVGDGEYAEVAGRLRERLGARMDEAGEPPADLRPA
jgi:uncharacterized sulfatase